MKESVKMILQSEFAKQFLIACLAIIYAVAIQTAPVNMHKIQFFERDPALSYLAVEPNQVPGPTMEGIVVAVPCFAILLSLALCKRPCASANFKRQLLVLFCLGVGLAQTLLFTICVNDTIKVVIARPRPIFFDLCDYQYYHTNRTLYNMLTQPGQLGDYGKCRADKVSFYDSLKSFPSGHAAYSFAGMLYATFVFQYIWNTQVFSATAARTVTQDQEKPPATLLSIGRILSIAPLYLAGWISITRVQDMEHHVEDIMGGALIGLGICWLVWPVVMALLRQVPCPETTATACTQNSESNRPADAVV